MSQDGESFLSRWSRRKHEARREEAAAPAAAPETNAAPAASADAVPPSTPPVASPEVPAELPAELPSIDSLDGLRSDYQAFLGKAVDEDTRRSALKKLFGDPHFNQMDGLDVYVDDYTQFEPMPAAMRLTLRHAREFLLDSERAAMGLAPSPGPEGAATAVASTAEAAVSACAPDPDLRENRAAAAAAPTADVAQTSALAAYAGSALLPGESLGEERCSTDDAAPAQPMPSHDAAARSAAPPPTTV